jgi:hypothetical protein
MHICTYIYAWYIHLSCILILHTLR